ncbi:MAG TPA: hypothetical protein VMM80_01940 [Bacteroidota bacterium]|nr:hypothetical protein [Bacteroidota bacterium]
MSPHIEYWGIPSPTEELFMFPLSGEGNISSADGSLQVWNRLFVLSVESEEEEADFIPESFE